MTANSFNSVSSTAAGAVEHRQTLNSHAVFEEASHLRVNVAADQVHLSNNFAPP